MFWVNEWGISLNVLGRDPPIYESKYVEPCYRLKGFRPPLWWGFQCPLCLARVKYERGRCWHCLFGRDKKYANIDFELYLRFCNNWFDRIDDDRDHQWHRKFNREELAALHQQAVFDRSDRRARPKPGGINLLIPESVFD